MKRSFFLPVGIVLVFAVALAGCSPVPVEPEPSAGDVETFDGSMVIQQGHTGSVNGVVYAHSGRFIATGSKDSTIRI